ncbi:MAG: sugar ABC transporter ATP-binding protein [Clostridiales bacterium]|nr:sugar ABC transporter ATP-binding protein [Clostridiales bacterium]
MSTSDQYIVEMNGISKSFPGVKALDDVRFSLKAGEVMALLGENGAGKSTLMKILSGVYQRDAGQLTAFGQDVEANLTPRKAQDLGIAIIHQELNMCQHLSVAENIFLGREILTGGRLNTREMNKQATEVLRSMNVDIAPTTIVGTLPLSKQQMVEIAKALSTNARVLIMDEPTSSLTAHEIENLFTIIRQLRDEGRGIVYISHRLEELHHIVDRVTILRDGQYIITMPFKETTLPEIISYMVGRDITEKYPRVPSSRGKLIFEARKLQAGRLVRDVSLKVYEGEIVGIAGLVGAGRTETTRVIFGADSREGGQFFLDDKEIHIRKPMDAIRHGVVLVPEDRKHDGLCVKLSVKSNIELPNLDFLSNKAGVVDTKRVTRVVKEGIQSLGIRLPGAEVNAASLSGGNQQKVVVAKWLARKSRLVIFDEPTRGIDVAAKVEIYHLMNKLKEQGIGVVFVSSEMPEVMGIADRIVVMCDGRVTGELMRNEATQEKIMALATQFEKKLDVAVGQ